MSKQAIVIGLGQFGMAVARALSDRGAEVLAIDRREDRVRLASNFAAESARFDATDSDALARTSPERREVCICAIGDESRESSIICTALLRQMGGQRVIARANDEVHARILRLVGAHQVVNPEQRFGERFASQILHEEVSGEMPIGHGLLITEFKAPQPLIGHPLEQLELPRNYGITVVAIRRSDETLTLPSPREAIQEDDVLVVVSRERAVAALLDRT